MRVVLVEDDKTMQRELTRIITAMSNSHVVFTADAAGLAVDWFAANPRGWDLAIVDIFLKDGHGFDVLRHCRKEMLPGQKAIMLSNYAREPVAIHAMAAGADRFFDKSHELDQLVEYCGDRHAELTRLKA